MRMDDDGMDIIERYAPLFLAIEGDNQKSAIRGQMQTIPGNIDDPVHGQPFVSKSWQNMENFWLTRSRIEDTAKFVDTNLTGFGLLESAGDSKKKFTIGKESGR